MKCMNFTPPYAKQGCYRGSGADARGRVPSNVAAAGHPFRRELQRLPPSPD